MKLQSSHLRLLPMIRPLERGRVGFLVALAALITLAQTVGLAGAEALFLARLGAGALPVTFVIAAATTVGATFLYALRVGRARNDRVFLELLLVGAAAVAAAGVGAALHAIWCLPALLCLFFATQAIFVNHFWTFSGDFFDTVAAKRVVPLFTVGMSFGGALGGALALALVGWAPAESLVLAWALLLSGAALLTRGYRTRLRRWSLVEFEEEDETSVAGMRVAARYLRGSSFGRWLVASALVMVLALFVAQYLYSEVLAREFPDEAALAAFLGLFLAVTNLLEMGIELWVVPRLIRRVGVPRANLVHPILTLVSFGGLALSFALPAALAARMNREMLENALAGPVRSLIYNGLPLRFRARIRALLEGMVVYAGMAGAGLFLLLFAELPVAWLCLGGAGLALLYLLANARVRHGYRRALVEELRARRLDLSAMSGELGRREISELGRIWAHLLRVEAAHPSPALLELAPLLAARGFLEPLHRALAHSHPRVREAALSALAATEMGEDATPWVNALRDRAPLVRLAALRCLPEGLAAAAALAEPLKERLSDADPGVRAEAARRSGEDGAPILVEMVRSRDAHQAVAALGRLPAALASEAVDRLDDGHPEVRAAALEGLARSGSDKSIATARLVRELSHPDPRVRVAAVHCLALRPDGEATSALASGLVDEARDVRRAAVGSLAERAHAADAVVGLLRADREATVRAALRVLGLSGTRRARALLRGELRRRVRGAWNAQLCLRVLPLVGEDAAPLLRLAYGDALVRDVRLAIGILAQLEDPAVVRSVERTLRFGTARARADALEVLANLADPDVAEPLALLLEQTPLEERLSMLSGFPNPPQDLDDVIERGRAATSRWIQMSTQAAVAQDAARGGENPMQRLLFLRQIGLFSRLNLEQLEALERMTREVVYVRGEEIVREGTPGKELYLIVEGAVAVFKHYGTPHQVRLNDLGPGSYFGEMAVLESAPRSASVVATCDARLLALEGERLRELIHQMPDIAFEIFPVLAARIRAAEERLAEAAPEGPAR